MKTNTTLMLIGAVILSVFAGAYISDGGLFSATSEADTTENNVNYDETIAVDFSSRNELSKGTSLTSGTTYRVFELPDYVELSDSSGTDISLQRGIGYEVLAERSGFITAFKELQVPTNEPVGTQSMNLFEKADFNTVVEFRNDDNTVNADGNALAIASGQSRTAEMKLQGVNNQKLPEGVMVVEVNNSEFDDVSLGNSPSVSTPESFVSSTVNSRAYAFETREVENTEEITQSLRFTAEDGVDPQAQSIQVTFYEKAYGVDSETGEITYGVEDSDGELLGEAPVTTQLYIE